MENATRPVLLHPQYQSDELFGHANHFAIYVNRSIALTPRYAGI
jgi:hypothetical protein